MERAIVHSDLKTEEIQPSNMLKRYRALLEKDILHILAKLLLKNFIVPLAVKRKYANLLQNLVCNIV